jgi:CRP-like cAMP-binding protein
MALNHLLSGLPRNGKRDGNFPGLERVELAFGQVLHSAGKRIAHVYFPTTALISLISDAKGDVAVELGVIGRDGMVGVAIALGEELSGARAIVQGAGAAMQCSSEDFTREFRRRAGMRRDIRRYSNDLANQFMATASCNRNHGPEQRLARWLLMMRDRMPGGRYTLTQKYLGYMLGVRRAAISEAAGKLQRRKLIRYTRGSIEILNAKGLKAASCKCYLPWQDRLAQASPLS